MDTAQVIEWTVTKGQYDLRCETAIVQHSTHGRVLIAQGYGGLLDLRGGAYRWQHGIACQLQPGDTLQSLSETPWNDQVSLYDAVINGYDDRRPMIDLGAGVASAYIIAKAAELAS